MFMVTTTGGVLGSVLAPVVTLLFGDLDVRLIDLSAWRVITGLGIGGMLAAILDGPWLSCGRWRAVAPHTRHGTASRGSGAIGCPA
jgi:hypothetical protein